MSCTSCPPLMTATPTVDATSLPICGSCGQSRSRRVRSLSFPGYPGLFHLRRCRYCGLVFNWPRLKPEQMRQQYDGNYYVFNSRPEHRWSRATQLYLNYLAPLEPCHSYRRLLEIGCAQGHLLAIAEGRGWQVEGVEISAEATCTARSEFGLSVHPGTLEEQPDAIGLFDVVVATDVIEHIANPRGFLRAVRHRLRAGGLAVIETPNWGGVWRRLGGRRWLGLNRFHISLFDGPCLTRLMRQCGFRPTATFTTTNTVWSDWEDRPELMSVLPLLPRGLQWRVRDRLSRLTPRTRERRLRQKPPTSLSAALDHIASSRQEHTGKDGNHETDAPFPADRWLMKDNLAVIGLANHP